MSPIKCIPQKNPSEFEEVFVRFWKSSFSE